MNDHPATILYPESFDKSPSAGFDGIFDWAWTEGCFEGRIRPMDFDGVVERNYHFLVFETKDEGREIPEGQIITLEHLRKPKSFTIMKIWGKKRLIKFEFQSSNIKGQVGNIIKGYSTEQARILIRKWWVHANRSK